MKRILLLMAVLLAGTMSAGEWEDDINAAARLHRKGDLNGAEEVLLKTMFKAGGYPNNDPRLAYTLDYLGTLNMQMNLPDKAAPLLERAVKAFELSRGKSAAETLESMGRLAESYDALGQYKKSEPLYVALMGSVRGDALQQSADINNLALCIDAQGRQDEAVVLYKQALAMREAHYGADSPDIAEILNNLARVYYMKGDFARAEEFYNRVISIDEAALSPGDPQLAEDYRRMAALYKKTGRAAEAAALEAKAEKKPEPPKKKKK